MYFKALGKKYHFNLIFKLEDRKVCLYINTSCTEVVLQNQFLLIEFKQLAFLLLKTAYKCSGGLAQLKKISQFRSTSYMVSGNAVTTL